MKTSLFSLHTAIVLQYIGIGLISGSISHGFFSGFRSFITALIGIIVFISGLYLERKILGKHTVNIGKILLVGVIFSISTAMVAGGLQHFLDSPWRSAWIIPVGYFVSLVVFPLKNDLSTSFASLVARGLVISAVIALITYPLARMTPVSPLFGGKGGHHGGEMSMDMMDNSDSSLREHCRQMPNMMGCEKWKNEKGMNMGHSMMDHALMVTSEEAFIVNMIPHHQEAVDTARLVLARGESPELKKLAQAIIAAQEKEISMMQQWLQDWKYTEVSPTYQNMMGDASKLSGSELDRWFLRGMIMHHMGAVEMAEKVLKLPARPQTLAFAEEIIALQTEEIRQMKLLLGEEMNDTRNDMIGHGH